MKYGLLFDPGARPTRGARATSSSTRCSPSSSWPGTGGCRRWQRGLKYFVLEDCDSAIGHQYQLIDHTKHPYVKIGPHRQTAALYDVMPATNRPAKPVGEWNTSRVVVRGNEVEHGLNGTKVLTKTSTARLSAAIAKSKFKDVERFGKPQTG